MKFTESLSKFPTFCQQTFRYSLRAQFDPLIQLSRFYARHSSEEDLATRSFSIFFFKIETILDRNVRCVEAVSREPYLRYLHDKSTA